MPSDAHTRGDRERIVTDEVYREFGTRSTSEGVSITDSVAALGHAKNKARDTRMSTKMAKW